MATVMRSATASSVAVARPAKAVLPVRRAARSLTVRAQASEKPVFQVSKAVATIAAASTALVATQAEAATELSQLAAGDNRGTIVLGVLLPAVGWVGFNILEALNNQIKRMDAAKGIAGAVGLGAASLLLAQSAEAATELSQLAAGDNRGTIVLGVLLPAVGWVGFNILEALNNQIKRMDAAKGVAGAVGLGAAASLLMAQSAEAATELSQLAAGDNRGTIVLGVLLPAVGWVGFNILEALNNQIKRMDAAKGVAGAVGLGAASLLMAQSAEAATEVAELAAGDNRAGIIAALLLPALGWVGFNIFEALTNQIKRMDADK